MTPSPPRPGPPTPAMPDPGTALPGVLDPGTVDDDDLSSAEVRARSLGALDYLGLRDQRMAMNLLEDLAAAADALAPLQDRPKVAVFGSARLAPSSEAYQAVVELSARLQACGYTIVTGGGPGLMTAGLEGAGPDHAAGIGIELPFEKFAPERFAVAQLKRFATRKLALVRHVRAVVAAAGGLGTADEVLECLVLLQTGRKRPTPVVLLDVATDQWARFDAWVQEALIPSGVVNAHDRSLYRVCTTIDEAIDEVVGFWRCYQGMPEDPPEDRLVLRLRRELTSDELARLRSDFADLCPDLGAETQPWPAPSGSTSPTCPAVSFAFDERSYSRLRELIDALNAL